MIDVRQMLVKQKQLKTKCPYPLEPEGWCVHNTANDASAHNEVQYMILNHHEVSYHMAVDDKEVVQGLPLDRNAWAAGDGGKGPGNRKYLHLEICYSRSGGERYTKAEQNAIKFLAQDLKQRGWGVDKVKKHQDFSGKNCPHRILDEKRWTSFIQAIEKEMNQKQLPKGVVQVVKALVRGDIRKGPSHSAPYLRDHIPGEIFHVYKRDGDWHCVGGEKGEEYWIDGNKGHNLTWLKEYV